MFFVGLHVIRVHTVDVPTVGRDVRVLTMLQKPVYIGVCVLSAV